MTATLRRNGYVMLACRLSRSGFSGERAYRVTLADGAEHMGVASAHHCRTPDLKPLGDEQPARGERIEGLMEGVLVDHDEVVGCVYLGDGEAVRVNLDQIRYAAVDHPVYEPVAP